MASVTVCVHGKATINLHLKKINAQKIDIHMIDKDKTGLR